MASWSDQDDCSFYDDDDCCYDDEDMEDLIDAPRYEYSVLGVSEIRRRQDDDIASVSSAFSVSRSDATALLLHFSWSVDRLNDAWIQDEQSVRRSAGLLDPITSRSRSAGLLDPITSRSRSRSRSRGKRQDEQSVRRSAGLLDPITSRSRSRSRSGGDRGGANSRVLCKICFESHKISSLYSAACAHSYCAECWTGYVASAVADGPGCLTLRCPDPSCAAVVTDSTILKFSPNPEIREKFSRYLIRSYIEDQIDTKWCPAPNCDFAVKFVPGSGGFDVKCLCSNQFCWNCCEESHQPVDCETVRKWTVKNSSESENVTYILAYTKPCPKCRRPIEKNHGCNHMTCNSACKHQFCWVCLKDWKGHENCNSYKDKDRDNQDNDEKMKERAKLSLQRYAHYYERWANNNKSRGKAVEDLEEMKKKHVETIKKFQIMGDSNKESNAEFIVEAWEQIIECRRVLKWTYAYGYYLPAEDKAKKAFFEYVQGEAEKGLERLHGYAEKEIKPYLELTDRSPSFDRFRLELVSLTKVTKTYFENLVKALQNGLADVESKC